MTSIRLFNKEYFDVLRLLNPKRDDEYVKTIDEVKDLTKNNDFYFIDVDGDTAGYLLANKDKVESIYVKDDYKEINILKDVKKLLKEKCKELILI